MGRVSFLPCANFTLVGKEEKTGSDEKQERREDQKGMHQAGPPCLRRWVISSRSVRARSRVSDEASGRRRASEKCSSTSSIMRPATWESNASALMVGKY